MKWYYDYRYHQLSSISKYFYPILRNYCNDKGLIKLDKCYILFNPIHYEIKKAKESLKELMNSGFIALGKRTDIKANDWYIRILPWYGEFPIFISDFKFNKNNSFEIIPHEFYKDTEFLPNQMSYEREEPLVESRKIITQKDMKNIFDYWKKVTEHPKAKFTTSRQSEIKKGLNQYSKKQFKKAIRGWQYSNFHRGKNDNGIIYDDIKYIIRNFDTFIQLDNKFGV